MPVADDSGIRISAKDFERIEYTIIAYNMTAKSTVPDTANIQLVEFGDDHADFTFPDKSCSQGHNIKFCVFMERLTPKKKKEIVKHFPDVEPQGPIYFSGKVTAMEPGSTGTIVVNVLFKQVDDEGWTAFCQKMAARQKQIIDQVKKMKD